MANLPTTHRSPLASQLLDIVHNVGVAAGALAKGNPLLIADDGSRENEIDLVFSATLARPELVNMALLYARGLVCVAMSPQQALACGLSPAPRFPTHVPHTHFTQSVDALHGIGSGISAQDRCTTIRLLGAAQATPWDFISPGHVFPVQAAQGGLLQRGGHTEACVQLCRVASTVEAAVMCEILDESGVALPTNALHRLPQDHPFRSLPLVTTAQLFWHGLCLGGLLVEQELLSWTSHGPGWVCQPMGPHGAFVPATLSNRGGSHTGLRVVWGPTAHPTDGGGWTLTLWAASEPLPQHWDNAVDLSHKEGVRIHPALQNLMTLLAATRRMAHHWGTSWAKAIELTQGCDPYKACLLEWANLEANRGTANLGREATNSPDTIANHFV